MSNRLNRRQDQYKPPSVVCLKSLPYRPGTGWPAQVKIRDAETNDAVVDGCDLLTAKAWLDCWGYCWVFGSNGYYTRPAKTDRKGETR